ncbi:hypothetical protein CBF45_10720 [Bordetella sp. J329]|nr:hypothetical protein CBF45_10720 [Bordetella sp. J329]
MLCGIRWQADDYGTIRWQLMVVQACTPLDVAQRIPDVAPRPRSRLTYNPSDSVAVGWYRIEPFDPRTASLPRPLSVDSIVLVPLLKRVGAVAPQQVCIVAGQVRIDGVPSAAVLPADRMGRALPSLQLCRRLEPGELFLLSVTNPASFDSRYFGPVSASAVIGVAHPVWLESRP